MKQIIVNIEEDAKRGAVAVTVEAPAVEGATSLECFTCQQMIQCFEFLISQGCFMPPPVAYGEGPMAVEKADIQFDIAKAGRMKGLE